MIEDSSAVYKKVDSSSEWAEDTKKPLRVLIWPDNLLMEKATEYVFGEPIRVPGRGLMSLQDYCRLLMETMEKYKGVGLASNQVGVLKRIMAVKKEDGSSTVLINPHVGNFERLQKWEKEGCLSFPGIDFSTKRYMEVQMDYTDIDQNPKVIYGKDLVAVELQHEFDHLDGITLMKWVKGSASRDMIRRRMEKLKRGLDRLMADAKKYQEEHFEQHVQNLIDQHRSQG